MSLLTNSGVLHFYEASKWQSHNRTYAYGQVSPLVEQLGVLPPFQFSKTLGDNAFTNPTLIRWVDGVETNIQIPLQLTGISGETVATSGNEIGYELIHYPGSAALPIVGLQEGLHYIRFEDDMGNFFYSEVFSWSQGLEYRDDFIKIEWWHNEDITFSGGKIKYVFPYKNRVWVQSDIGKPEYPVTEKAVVRDGVNLPVQTICYKKHAFQFLASEHLLDSMYLVRAHDNVVITHMGKVIGEGDFDKIFEFLLTPEWLEQGNVATVDVEFRTNKVVIVNGRGYDSISYEPEECGCFTVNYMATAWIKQPSAEYTGGYYIFMPSGVPVNFANGDYVIIENALGISSLKQWNGSAFISVTLANGETVCTAQDSRNPYAREDNYFFKTLTGLAQNPIVDSETQVDGVYTISGQTFENTLIEIWLRTDDGDILQGTYTENDFSTGITFDATGSNAYTVRARTYICENLGQAEWVGFEGIGWWEIENDFEVQ